MILKKITFSLLLSLFTSSILMASTPTLIAHRGASGYRPENTIDAFELAYEMGAKALEFDCWLSRDGKVVVIHDHALARTTNGKECVTDYDLSSLKKLDAGSHLNPKFANVTIPTLEEVLLFAKGKDLHLYIELKDRFIAVADKTQKLIRKYDMLDQVHVISFEHHLLDWLFAHHPDISLGFSSKEIYPELSSDALKINAEGVMVPYQKLTSEAVDAVKSAGLEIWTFTVNDPAFLEEEFFPQISGYCSNYPDLPMKDLTARSD